MLYADYIIPLSCKKTVQIGICLAGFDVPVSVIAMIENDYLCLGAFLLRLINGYRNHSVPAAIKKANGEFHLGEAMGSALNQHNQYNKKTVHFQCCNHAEIPLTGRSIPACSPSMRPASGFILQLQGGSPYLFSPGRLSP